MSISYVVTGGARGVGRAIVERLAGDPGTALVVALDREAGDPLPGAVAVVGDAADEAVAAEAADRAEAAAPLGGWVNDAAVFRGLALPGAAAADLLDAIVANLALAVVGRAPAVRRFRAAGTGGAIVNVSSHQRVSKSLRACSHAGQGLHNPLRPSARSPGRSPTPPPRRRSRD